jgi:hypothetical protein
LQNIAGGPVREWGAREQRIPVEKKTVIGATEDVAPGRSRLAGPQILEDRGCCQLSGKKPAPIISLQDYAGSRRRYPKRRVGRYQSCCHLRRAIELALNLGKIFGIHNRGVVAKPEAIIVVDEKFHDDCIPLELRRAGAR